MLEILFSAPALAFVAGLVIGAAGTALRFIYVLRRAILEAEYGKAGADLLLGR